MDRRETSPPGILKNQGRTPACPLCSGLKTSLRTFEIPSATCHLHGRRFMSTSNSTQTTRRPLVGTGRPYLLSFFLLSTQTTNNSCWHCPTVFHFLPFCQPHGARRRRDARAVRRFGEELLPHRPQPREEPLRGRGRVDAGRDARLCAGAQITRRSKVQQ